MVVVSDSFSFLEQAMSFPMRQIFLSALALAVTGILAGCRSFDESFTPYLTKIYLQESPNLPASHIQEMVLPMSGTRVTVGSRPRFVEWDILRAAYFDTEMGRAVMLVFTPDAAGGLYNATINNQGRNLVLTINGVPVGGHYIDGPIQDGRLAFFLEIESDAIPEVVEGIQKTSDKIQNEMKSGRW